MTKTIMCPVCEGKGFINHYEIDNSIGVWSETCNCCYGSGKQVVPMINYDVFMYMKPDELAHYIECPYTRGDPYGECKFGWHNHTQTCHECITEWLNLQAEEKYYEFNEDE